MWCPVSTPRGAPGLSYQLSQMREKTKKLSAVTHQNHSHRLFITGIYKPSKTTHVELNERILQPTTCFIHCDFSEIYIYFRLICSIKEEVNVDILCFIALGSFLRKQINITKTNKRKKIILFTCIFTTIKKKNKPHKPQSKVCLN